MHGLNATDISFKIWMPGLTLLVPRYPGCMLTSSLDLDLREVNV